MRVVGALLGAQVLLVAAEHERAGRQQLEVVGFERSRLVGAGERGMRLRPRSLLDGFAAVLELLHRGLVSASCHHWSALSRARTIRCELRDDGAGTGRR